MDAPRGRRDGRPVQRRGPRVAFRAGRGPPSSTTALIAATCAEVAASPPGTAADVFRFRGQFVGTVDGQPVAGPLTYAGVTQAGGHIDALITLRGDVSAVLRADAVVAQGGSYAGIVRG